MIALPQFERVYAPSQNQNLFFMCLHKKNKEKYPAISQKIFVIPLLYLHIQVTPRPQRHCSHPWNNQRTQLCCLVIVHINYAL